MHFPFRDGRAQLFDRKIVLAPSDWVSECSLRGCSLWFWLLNQSRKIVLTLTLVLVGRIFQPQSCTPGMKRRREHNFSQLGSSARCGDPVCGEVVARSSPWQMCWGSWCLPRGVARGVLSNRIATGVRGTAPQRTLQTHEPGRPTGPTRLRQGVGGRLRQGAGGRRVAICVSQVLTCVTCMVRPR